MQMEVQRLVTVEEPVVATEVPVVLVELTWVVPM